MIFGFVYLCMWESTSVSKCKCTSIFLYNFILLYLQYLFSSIALLLENVHFADKPLLLLL